MENTLVDKASSQRLESITFHQNGPSDCDSRTSCVEAETLNHTEAGKKNI